MAEQKNLSMILDEQLTAMIPPPDLWGSTGYTANNNKVGFKYAFLLELLRTYLNFNKFVYTHTYMYFKTNIICTACTIVYV